MTRCRGARLVGLTLLWTLTGTALRAQSTTQPRADSLRNAQDTVDLSARYLEGEALAKIRLPVVPRLVPDAVMPHGSVIVLDQASLEWATAESVADLLLEVPGLYLWRGGWIGRPEYASYQGRGATSVEYYLDGLPFTPVGPDSVGIDPALLPLRLLERVEIERWAGLLRVQLYTPRHDVVAAGTGIQVSSGDQGTARYGASLQKRYRSGFGYGLAANYWNADTYDAAQSAARQTDVWLQLSYLKAGRWGLQYQLMAQAPDREPYVTTVGDTIGAGVKGQRSDMQFRAFLQGGKGDLARRVDLVFSATGWSGDDISQQINGVGLVASWRRPTLSASMSGFLRSEWTRADVRGNVGWAPTRAVSASLEGAWLSLDDSRQSQWIGARAGLALPYGFGLSGSARLGKVVAAPAIESNAAQTINDLTGTLTWQRGWLSLQADLSQTSAFNALAPQPYLDVPALAATDATTWLTIGGRIAPVSWIILESRYSDPTGGTPNGNPPTHSLTTATIRSKFIRTFPSGSFDLKAQVGVETWGSGVLGVDTTAAPILLPGATFFRAYLEVGLGSFRFYYDRMNLLGTEQTYVPGFVIPRYGSTYGVRWTFVN